MIGPTCVVVPADDFASVFADLEALEPVASVPFLALDPRREFFLSCRRASRSLSRKTFRFRAAPARSRVLVGGCRSPARKTSWGCKAHAAEGPQQPRERLAGALLKGAPWGGGGAVCRAGARHAQRRAGGGLKIAAAAAPYSVRGEHTLRRALEHSADYAGGSRPTWR